MAFPNTAGSNCIETIHCVGITENLLTSLFDDYEYRRLVLEGFLLYNYTKLVTTVGKLKRRSDNISFSEKHPYFESRFQRILLASLSCNIFVVPISLLLSNKDAEDAVLQGHVETDAQSNNPGLILLSLFVSWELLPSKFDAFKATLSDFEQFCWQVWEELILELFEYG